jgi:folate-binding protein YgfZ
MTTQPSSPPETIIGYQAALESAAFYRLPESGYLRIAGPDQASFIQRQTTNDINRLAPAHSLVTVLTSATGRILDVLTLFNEPGGALGALSLPGQASRTANFLKSRIFFMDKVGVVDASREWAQFELTGPRAGSALDKLGCSDLPQVEGMSPLEISGVTVSLLRQPARPGMEFLLLVPAGAVDVVIPALRSAGVTPLTPEVYNILRLEAGIPGAGTELTSDYTPLEIGLLSSIAEDKGCYTGQEVIARQSTYDKITQHLVGLHLQTLDQTGDQVFANDRLIGTITSCAISPRFGPIALAVIKRPYHQPGAEVRVGSGKGEIPPQPARVTALPFSR